MISCVCSQQTGHQPVYAIECSRAKPAQVELFTSYVNEVLHRALRERLARWGNEFIDPNNVTEPSDRLGKSMGVRVYEAFSCQFGMLRNKEKGVVNLALTVDSVVVSVDCGRE